MKRISSRTYSWSQTEIRVMGLLMVEIIGIEWDETQEMEFVYGKGSDPLDIAEGNVQITGTLTLLQGDLEALQDISPDGKLYKLKDVDIQCAFVKDEITSEIVRYSLTGVRFQGSPKSLKQNDKRMEVACPFMALASRRVSS